MSDSNSGIDEVPQVGRIIFFGSIAALAVAALVGVWLVFNFIEDEKERDLHAWQVRLNIVADTRVAAVNQWVDDQFATMRELVENESLQIYMSEIAEVRAGEGDPEAADAEVGYLRNLLVATANRNGFVAPVEAIEVDANVERAGIAGLAVTDENGNILVATPDMPPSTPQIREAIGRASGGEAVLIDIHAGAGNQPVIGFVLPVLRHPGRSRHGQAPRPGDRPQATRQGVLRLARTTRRDRGDRRELFGAPHGRRHRIPHAVGRRLAAAAPQAGA